MTYYIFKPSNTETISGDWNGDTLSAKGILKQIFVKFETSSTVFDLVIYDEDDLIVLNRIEEVGILNELIEFPFSGIYTICIENATNDEAFDLRFYIHE